ncbi:glycoside hydrolase family 3 N-terminal domain-containing protein [Inconstantimicrobium mannanitabidum]|uniref:Glycosyl hydrolase n=1 Tax=Inconstantimicrobium mannanitabidum TaxID=1604901 RepID=A0ACB5R9P7_9CLOT|nr:glycoside hydrolase family 3 N-terminal domain-containing protein [Clostridium sp. TW13]GKX65766.1 glycosyl hydrolase [Clostridium sp. TW13]
MITEKQHEQIISLLNQMTLEEKIGQLQQLGPSLVGAFEVSFEELLDMMFDGRISEEEFHKLISTAKEDLREDDVRAGKIGSFNGLYGAEKINYLQKIAVEESRLGIPLLFGADIIHGMRTVYPIPLAESCAFDPKLWEETAEMAAKEATSSGIHWTFGPMIDVARDARWGRISEGAGEDTYLNSVFARAKVKGFQGGNPAQEDRLLACAKHFIAYGAAESGRDYNTTDISMQKLHEVYLPPFKAAIDVGVASIMPSFNDVNGVPVTANNYLLNNILKEECGFGGLLVSDANAIAELVNHGFAEDQKEASKLAIEAGMNMDMSSKSYSTYLKELVEEEKIKESLVDNTAYKVLKLKMEKGLFENPYQTNKVKEENTILKPEFREKAKEAALKSMVLLKNEDILPLSSDKKIGLVGNLAESKGQMLGAWAINGHDEDCISILEGLKAKFHKLKYEACIKDSKVDVSAVNHIAEECDVIVAVVGEIKEMSGEAASRSDISLPQEQEELLKALYETGKPVVAVLVNGRPLAISWVSEHVQAILEAWHGGIEAGNAVAEILLGLYNPSGKLSVSFPQSTGACPCYYNHPSTGRPAGKSKFTSKYLDIPSEPVYSFGYGLSYTTYEYSDLQAVIEDNQLRASITVTNAGEMDGEETVQLYIQDVAAKRVRPVRELKSFRKVTLEKGESKKVDFIIPVSELGYYDNSMNYIVEVGMFKIYAGGSLNKCLEIEVELK